MLVAVQSVTEELPDITATVFAGRQADTVDDDQADIGTGRPSIEIRRSNAFRALQPAGIIDD